MDLAIAFAYLAVLAALAVFGSHRLHLLGILASTPAPGPEPEPPSVWPLVTVQLPLYNEAAVAGRLIDAVAELDYPRDRLEVQVLDDSTDETAALVAERVAFHHARGLSIEHVRRSERSGFKAGALAHGLERTAGELVAIFDADFVPTPDFLRRTVPWLARDPGLGLVQARWDHLNRGDGLLTRLQALALDAHFLVEQAARSQGGRFFNFNGTAGVFRREAIEAAGGWASDTITEDLDLSLRAQLCGWRFLFLPEVGVPSELPRDLDAFRAQQKRWTRGSAQTTRKLLGQVWRTPEVAFPARIEASCQLLLNAAYPLMLLLVLLSVPLAAVGYPEGTGLVALQWLLFALASGSVALFYVASQRRRGWLALLEGLVLSPPLFALGLGLSLSNGLAWLAGLGGKKVAFERTPKEGEQRRVRYRAKRGSGVLLGEVALLVYLLVGLGVALPAGRWSAVPFLLLMAAGFATLVAGSLRARLRGIERPATDPVPPLQPAQKVAPSPLRSRA